TWRCPVKRTAPFAFHHSITDNAPGGHGIPSADDYENGLHPATFSASHWPVQLVFPEKPRWLMCCRSKSLLGPVKLDAYEEI
ncbi:MAG: hypothetical protein ACK58T_08260, partial [Phycisphaerae bacterium]